MDSSTINGKQIRRKVQLYTLYKAPQAGIMEDSPELLMMRRIAEGKASEAADLFPENKQFSSAPCVVDTPYERFEGKEAILKFARGFVKRFRADGLSILPMFQTRSGGRSVTEMVLNSRINTTIIVTFMTMPSAAILPTPSGSGFDIPLADDIQSLLRI